MRISLIILLLWSLVVSTKGQNSEKILNKTLIQRLDTILLNDQFYRNKSDSIASKFGYDSKEMQDHYQKMYLQDSVNSLKVSEIIDKYGWLGPEVVGKNGNLTLFLVIQHSDLKVQEKYLPIMKDAARDGKLSQSDLALLIDRVEMFNHRPQIYGSQIQRIGGKFVFYQIKDEKNVNKRRAEVGLEPIEEYAKNWDIDYKPLNN